MINNVLFICIGNICRSPMAEGLFRQLMPEKAVYSAGIHALVGEPADPLALQLMEERGIDISEHRARSLAAWMVNEADLILTMDQYQRRFIEFKFPAAKGKVMRLGEQGNYDISDPYKQGMSAFRHSCHLIAMGVDRMASHIASLDAKAYQVSYARTAHVVTPLPFVP
ncbi:low molecular weight protein-tyrosine-phosphatase [Oxalobacteraceae bacterium R-40]|uniref:protein-tyrosine-phosphatase n=1 Tax=Keguizhuia sedimenti TaxID=3064264 RepID=A0ABU1BSJ0_9BURK|nr:low molecular weight protein-tyrosine-phosphatase [Oxalobacteraceae bacterium R-40]